MLQYCSAASENTHPKASRSREWQSESWKRKLSSENVLLLGRVPKSLFFFGRDTKSQTAYFTMRSECVSMCNTVTPCLGSVPDVARPIQWGRTPLCFSLTVARMGSTPSVTVSIPKRLIVCWLTCANNNLKRGREHIAHIFPEIWTFKIANTTELREVRGMLDVRGETAVVRYWRWGCKDLRKFRWSLSEKNSWSRKNREEECET